MGANYSTREEIPIGSQEEIVGGKGDLADSQGRWQITDDLQGEARFGPAGDALGEFPAIDRWLDFMDHF